MSSFCQSPPKRTSIAKAKNEPRLSWVGAACVTRTRRSCGGGRSREKRLTSRSARRFTIPASTRRCAHSTSDGSSAEASDGTSDSTSRHGNSERSKRTGAPFNGGEAEVSIPKARPASQKFDNRDTGQHRYPQRGDVGDAGIDTDAIEAQDH